MLTVETVGPEGEVIVQNKTVSGLRVKKSLDFYHILEDLG